MLKMMRVIDPRQTYYLHEIAREGWLGTKSPFLCRRIITEYQSMLHPEFIGKGRATRILILGKRIQAFQRYAAIVQKREA